MMLRLANWLQRRACHRRGHLWRFWDFGSCGVSMCLRCGEVEEHAGRWTMAYLRAWRQDAYAAIHTKIETRPEEAA